VSDRWVWLDVIAAVDDMQAVTELTAGFDFDKMALRDVVEDVDLSKVDDFGGHLLVVLHGLREDEIETYDVGCFVTEQYLVTVHRCPSPSLDFLWDRILENAELANGGVDHLLARIADVLTRRLLAVVDAFDDAADALIDGALAADPVLLTELTAIRTDLGRVRRVVHPQRETLDLLRRSPSPLITDTGHRRFSDVFDVAVRATQGLEAARTSLAEILDAYRGAEAQKATNVTTVLTVYAAIMLPLSLIAGFFGMNFINIPGFSSDWGWIIVTVVMVAIAVISLGIFIAAGWVRRPSGRRAGRVLGRGLIEAARAPAQVVGAAYEISTMPLKATVRRTRRGAEEPERGD
jgi:magnesium transporter